MKIDIKNYELYVIDYLDGNLDSDLNAQFESFLNLNPEIKNDILDLKSFSLEPNQNLNFKNKNILKKEEIQSLQFINEKNYNEYFIAFYEGDLNDSEIKIVMDFIELNPQTKADFDLFSKIIIKPQEDLVFLNKNSLKRKSVFINFNKIITYTSSVAAVLLIGTTLFLLIPQINVDNITTSKADSRNINANEKIETLFSKEEKLTQEIQFAEINKRNYQDQKSLKNTYVNKLLKNNSEIKQLSSSEFSYLHSNMNIQLADKRTEFTDAYNALLIKNLNIPQFVEIEEPIDIVQNIRNYSEDALSVFNKLRSDNQQIAKIGVEGVNRLSDRYSFYLKKNEDGNLTHLAINDFAIPLRKNR